MTDESGRPCVLPENKATILTLEDSRLLVGFAGLAKAGRFRTGHWVLDALTAAGTKGAHRARATVEAFTEIATQRFSERDLRAVPRNCRGLSLLFTGYNDTRPPPNLIAALVTNFQNFESGRDEEPWDEFRTTYWSIEAGTPADEATYMQRIGTWVAMEDDRDLPFFRRLLEERKDSESLIRASVGKVREIAARPSARNLIGKELSVAVLSAGRPVEIDRGQFPIQMGFHPEGASDVLRGVSQVVSLPSVQLALRDPEVRAVDPAGAPRPMAVQKVGRNKPCPCGSGKKYKRCCGA